MNKYEGDVETTQIVRNKGQNNEGFYSAVKVKTGEKVKIYEDSSKIIEKMASENSDTGI